MSSEVEMGYFKMGLLKRRPFYSGLSNKSFNVLRLGLKYFINMISKLKKVYIILDQRQSVCQISLQNICQNGRFGVFTNSSLVYGIMDKELLSWIIVMHFKRAVWVLKFRYFSFGFKILNNTN